jgi:hypothetical protein
LFVLLSELEQAVAITNTKIKITNKNNFFMFDTSQIESIKQKFAVSLQVEIFLKNIDQNKEHFGNREFGSLNMADLKPLLPQLTSGITVNKVDLNGIVDKNNYLVEQDATIYVSGKDAKGTVHNLVLSIKNQFDHINSSKVDTIDLKGKKVVTVQNKFKRHED